MWTHQDSIDTLADPATVWRFFADVPGWQRWNEGIARIEIHGPFAPGTQFFMEPPGEEGFTSTLLTVEGNRGFTDETWIGETRVLVHHRLEPLARGTRITYATEITGPEAASFGPLVTGDFPQVLAALKALAEAG